MVEHSAVNRRVVGSSPTWGAKRKGVVSLKRGNPFLVQKKHSDYENPNACGRM